MPVYHVKGQATTQRTGVRHIRRTSDRLKAVEQQARTDFKPETNTTDVVYIGIQEARRQALDAGLPDAEARVNAAVEGGAIAGAVRGRIRWSIPQLAFTAWLEAQLG